MLSEVAHFQRMVLGNFASRGDKESGRIHEGEAWGPQNTGGTVMIIIHWNLDCALSEWKVERHGR